MQAIIYELNVDGSSNNDGLIGSGGVIRDSTSTGVDIKKISEKNY